MTNMASGSTSRAAAASRVNTHNGLYNQPNNAASSSYSNNNKIDPSPSRHFYLNGDEEDEAIDELRAIGSNVVPYELDTGSYDGNSDDGVADGTETQQDDDELSTTSGRRHGALLQPEEADMLIFEVSRKRSKLAEV
jgi:hypothetical protein